MDGLFDHVIWAYPTPANETKPNTAIIRALFNRITAYLQDRPNTAQRG